jgi:4-amino-4-deoxy-L-arabinose transferase-like glycosyltransferase
MVATPTVSAGEHVSEAPLARTAQVRALWQRPGWRTGLLIGAAVVVGLALRLLIAATDDAPSTDETAYLRSGLSLIQGDGFQRNGRPELHFPPLVPFLMGVASKAFTDPHDGAVALTTIAGTAAIIPLALTAGRLGGRRAAVATAWVAALTPAISTTLINRGGGSEGEYTLLVALAVWLAISAAGSAGRSRLLRVAGAGLSVGLAYLTRPEGLFLAVPLGLGVLWLAFREVRRDGLRAQLRAVVPMAAAFAAPIIVCVIPYAAFLHSHTGSWELSAKTQDASIEAWSGVARGDREARDVALYDIDEGFRFTAESHSLPSLARDEPGEYAGIVGANVRMLARTIVNPDGGTWVCWQLLPLPVWALAVWGAWRRWSGPMAVVVAVGMLPVTTALVFFVQPRYLVVTAALATIPVGVLLASLPRPRRRVVGGVAFAFLSLSVALAFHGGGGWWHPTDHTSQRGAGDWIAAHTHPDERIMARSQVVEYYSHRTTIALPYTDYDTMLAYGRYYGVQYLVLDENTASRLRPQFGFLRFQDRAPGLRLVHEAAGEGGETRIFAFDPAPPTDVRPGPHLGFVGDGAA